ncbi:hypothetical protein GJAV_G00211080 [Gymnothorax javanicus]|nr:hypothetical protein GJAV_G00211080 [Gymnothorax javanicus]
MRLCKYPHTFAFIFGSSEIQHYTVFMCSTEDLPPVENDQQKEEELETWKNKLEKAETEKSRLLLEKLSSEDAKKQAYNEMMKQLEQQKDQEAKFKREFEANQENIRSLEKRNLTLMAQLKTYEDALNAKRAEYLSLQQKAKVKVHIPETKVKFVGVEEEGEYGCDDIVGVFTIIQKPSVRLTGGQALITFEEEQVAENILRLPKCPVECDKTRMDLKPCSVTLDPSVKFEVHTNVSKRKIRFNNLAPYLPAERMRDRLEIGFSRPSRGGGEVENVVYNIDKRKGEITFLNTGVAESLVLRKKYTVDDSRKVSADIHPYFDYQLKNFQMCSGVVKRTVLLDGIRDVEDAEDLQDHLEIHFQKPCNYGGEVESIKYISRPNAAEAYFTEDAE